MTPKSMSTILVIEDYSDSRELFCSLLRAKGYHVIEADNGRKGLLEAKRQNPDLILMDLAMPEMDGIEATRQIRQMSELAETPIFAISAYTTDEVRADAIAAGCTEVFSKPVNMELFLKRIEEILISNLAPRPKWKES